jgi:cobalt-zinc-cadmium efflux system membrane fusion protein
MRASHLLLMCLAMATASACGRGRESENHNDGEHAEAAGGERAEAGHHDGEAEAAGGEHAEDGHHSDEAGEADTIRLTEAQISAADIAVAPVRSGMAGAVTVPAVVAADPERSAVVAAAVGGRITSLSRNLGERVRRGDALAVIESREAAELQAEVEAARQRLALAQATLRREEQLFRERVSPEQDVLAARTAAAEARIRLRLAQQRLGTTGGSGGALNRIVVRSPLSGHAVAREVALGEVVAADAELFRVADLSTMAVELALLPDAAAQVEVGSPVHVSTADREATGRVAFLSPVIDPHTRQVRAIATLPNPQGQWRVGETVQAAIAVRNAEAKAMLAVPKTAIQTVEDKPSVFVRTPDGFAVKHLEIGPVQGDYVTVLSGLDGGERVAVRNSYVLKAELGKGEGGEHAH